MTVNDIFHGRACSETDFAFFSVHHSVEGVGDGEMFVQ